MERVTKDRIAGGLAVPVALALISIFIVLVAWAGIAAAIAFASGLQQSTAYPAPQPVVYESPDDSSTVADSSPQPVASEKASSSLPAVSTVVQPAPPNKLIIPSIGVNADVGQVAVTEQDGQNVLYPPDSTSEDLTKAYWWNERSAPGSKAEGTTFIIGHTCHSAGCPAVFNDLQNITVGATIMVSTPKGKLTYEVDRTKVYADAAGRKPVGPEVYADVPNRLVLVTCKLNGDGSSQTDIFVVWAELKGAVSK